MIAVIVKPEEITRRRLSVIPDDADTSKNCSYCCCFTEIEFPEDSVEPVFSCSKLMQWRIEKKKTGLDCEGGTAHIYRDISRDPEIIPYKLITDHPSIAGSNIKTCHNCQTEYDEVEKGYPYEYCPKCGVLAKDDHYVIEKVKP